MMKQDICTTQLIHDDGEFNVAGLNSFVQKVKFDKCGTSYAVVAIMGPQSGGKSTLMNHLFGTAFQEMKMESGKSQTTKGIWIARCVSIEPCTIAMDLEGSDSSERGEVMMRISGDLDKKTTLMFVVRDKPSKAPPEQLEDRLMEETEKMWDAISKPQAHKNSPLTVFFNVQFVHLSNFIEKEEEFKKEVAQLRQRVVNSISPGGLVCDRKGVVPASVFSLSTKAMWTKIKQNKDLDLPAHKVMVANVRCEEISTDIFKKLMENTDWLALQKAAETGPVPDFGKRVSSILDDYLSEYDGEAVDFDEGVRKSKRDMLESKALQSAHAVYNTMLGHLCSKAFEGFKVGVTSLNPEKEFAASLRACILSSMHEFRQGCADAAVQQSNWSFSSIVDKLQRDIDAHASSYEQIVASLTSQIDAEFGCGGEHMWVSIRRIFKLETENAISRLLPIKVSFELDQKAFNAMEQDLINLARNVVEQKARENIVEGKVLAQMKKRFSRVFCYDSNSQPRVWKGMNEIAAATKEASSASLKILAVMATIDMDEKPNYVEEILFSCLMEETEDALPSSWQNVSSRDTIFTPRTCQQLWDLFKEKTQKHIVTASSVVEANEQRNRKLVEIAARTAAALVKVVAFSIFRLRFGHFN
ncbi:hypothetical protein C1H46_029825 [Malus baccata]|uniref:GB1/RHD3-type G domain-containing protein n=1 Tax=Malus baccata TaxID=106549 RepID=A0A540LDR9_MALBA|nr:hypothetical protein C1H46_029825 [Malus baccata]